MRSKHGSDSTSSHKVEILCIPASGSEFEHSTVRTVTDDKNEWKNIDARTVKLEHWLGHTPNLQWFHTEGRIDLKYLSLFDRDPCAHGSTASKAFKPGDLYYIYKCVTETPAKLPVNTHLDRFKEARAYGDAFIFKVIVEDDFDQKDKADFDSMGGFLEDFGKGGSAFEILALMARW